MYHFVSKKAFHIDGLGPKIIDLLLEYKLISSYSDIFTLRKGDILQLPGFKEKATENLLSSIVESTTIELPKFLFALSIDQVGEETAADLAEAFGSLEKIRSASVGTLQAVEGVGPKVSESMYHWFRNTENQETVDKLLKYVTLKPYHPKKKTNLPFQGKTFVLTGTLQSLTRDEAKARVKRLGGTVSNSVSRKTDFVVAGEDSGSKYDRAKALNIPILNEKEFLAMVI